MCVFAGSRNQNSLRYTNMVCKILNSFSQWIIHIGGRISVRLPKKAKILKIYPITITRISQRGNSKL